MRSQRTGQGFESLQLHQSGLYMSGTRTSFFTIVLNPLTAKKIIKNGKSPQWSTTIDNIASQKLAEKVGSVKLADVITATL